MIDRHIASNLITALHDSPVVLLVGARQTGKSTLARWVASKAHPARYLTLDDGPVLAAAREDPAGFVAGLEGPVVLDEVQRAPDLFLAIKAAVDRNRRPGRFLLTGSANVLLLPRVSESLAGRMRILTLWPLSQGELEGSQEGFVDVLFAKQSPKASPSPVSRPDLFRRMLTGGYPEAVALRSEPKRRAWFESYTTTILQRDVRDLANIEGLTELPSLLSLLATRTGGPLNFAELARSRGLPQTTLKRYLVLLETTFLFQPLPAWSKNLGKRLVKSPKVVLNDTGLAAYLLGLNAARLSSQGPLAGPLLENFAAMELRKQIAWSRIRPRLFHFRSQTGREVDLVMEDAAGRCVGVEIKVSASVTGGDFKGLRALAEALGNQFVRGVVLYGGAEVVPFGRNLHAMPISALWRI